MKDLLALFNWKERPATVWFVAAPLAILGICLMIGRGVLEIVRNGDWTYLIINVVMLAIMVAMFIPAWKQYKIAMARKAEYEARKKCYGVDEE